MGEKNVMWEKNGGGLNNTLANDSTIIMIFAILAPTQLLTYYFIRNIKNVKSSQSVFKCKDLI